LKKISAVISACNEEKRIGDVIVRLKNFVNEVIVIDDYSYDKTQELTAKAEAKVVFNNKKKAILSPSKKDL